MLAAQTAGPVDMTGEELLLASTVIPADAYRRVVRRWAAITPRVWTA